MALAVEDVTRRYGDTTALDGVSLEVGEGRICALLGANGAGKTTLVRIVATLLRPTSGTVTVLGHDVGRESHRVRSAIGVVGQYAAVDEVLTGRENLVMFGRLRLLDRGSARRRADQLLDELGLTDAADRPVSGYSGGMRRRLDLAAALVSEPRVLLVDEPTTGLDPVSRRELWARFRRLSASGTAVLLTTQQLEEADHLADDVVVLKEGKVLLAGTAAQVRALGGPPRTVVQQPSLEDVYLRLHSLERNGARG